LTKAVANTETSVIRLPSRLKCQSKCNNNNTTKNIQLNQSLPQCCQRGVIGQNCCKWRNIDDVVVAKTARSFKTKSRKIPQRHQITHPRVVRALLPTNAAARREISLAEL
jgi:hypothetical protein